MKSDKRFIRPLSFALFLLFSVRAQAMCGATPNLTWYDSLDDVLCAFKLTTKQVEAEANKAIDAMAATREVKAHADKELALTLRITDVANKFAPVNSQGNALGQSPFMCTTNTIERSLDRAEKEASTGAHEWSANLYQTSSATGDKVEFTLMGVTLVSRRNAKSRSMISLRELHNQRYCTHHEAEAGLCTLSPNALQAADIDSSLLNVNDTYAFDQQLAASAYVSRIAPIKTIPTLEMSASPGCKTAQCSNAATQMRRQEAMRSIARYALLRQIEARTTGERNGPMGSFNNK